MQIQNAALQWNQVDANATSIRLNTNTIISAVGNLAHHVTDTKPSPLALTHQFIDIQIQKSQLSLTRMKNKLVQQLESSSSDVNATFSVSNARICTRIGEHIVQKEERTQALKTLKERGFQPVSTKALTVPLSGKALGAGDSDDEDTWFYEDDNEVYTETDLAYWSDQAKAWAEKGASAATQLSAVTKAISEVHKKGNFQDLEMLEKTQSELEQTIKECRQEFAYAKEQYTKTGKALEKQKGASASS